MNADAMLVLPRDLSIAQADALHAQLMAQRDRAEVILDGCAVESADTAGLQLLCAFVKDRRAAGQAVAWRDPSEPLRRTAAVLGLDTFLFTESQP